MSFLSHTILKLFPLIFLDWICEKHNFFFLKQLYPFKIMTLFFSLQFFFDENISSIL